MPPSLNSHIEALTSNIALIGNRVSKELIRAKGGHKDWTLICLGVLPGRGKESFLFPYTHRKAMHVRM